MICTQFRFFIFVLLFLLVIAGCTVQVRYPSEFPSKTVITNEETFWFWGLIGEKNYEVNDLCPQGRVYSNGVNGVGSPTNGEFIATIERESPITIELQSH